MKYFRRKSNVKWSGCPMCGAPEKRMAEQDGQRRSPVQHPVKGYVRGTRQNVDPRQMSLFAARSSGLRPDIQAQLARNLASINVPWKPGAGASIRSQWRPWVQPWNAYAPQGGPAANGIGNRARGPYCGQRGTYYRQLQTRAW